MNDQYLHEAHTKEVTSQRALLLGVAASAIAFALHETSDRAWAWSLAVIATAVLCWAASFAAGIWHSHWTQASIAGNIAANVAERSVDQEKYDRAHGSLTLAQSRAGLYYRMQLWCLLAGAVIYVAGHGTHIWEAEQKRVSEANAKQKPNNEQRQRSSATS